VLRDAEIESLPALTIIGRYAQEETLIYADPPYVLTTRKGERFYQHEMNEADHVALLDALDAHPGPVLLSGYQSKLYSDRLSHWRRVETTAAAEAGQTRTECLWLNSTCVAQLGYGPLFEQESA
jgi:DNA adenine methylase